MISYFIYWQIPANTKSSFPVFSALWLQVSFAPFLAPFFTHAEKWLAVVGSFLGSSTTPAFWASSFPCMKSRAEGTWSHSKECERPTGAPIVSGLPWEAEQLGLHVQEAAGPKGSCAEKHGQGEVQASSTLPRPNSPHRVHLPRVQEHKKPSWCSPVQLFVAASVRGT